MKLKGKYIKLVFILKYTNGGELELISTANEEDNKINKPEMRHIQRLSLRGESSERERWDNRCTVAISCQLQFDMTDERLID